MRRRRVTKPPNVLPLLLLGFVAVLVGGAVIELVALAVAVVGLPLEGTPFAGGRPGPAHVLGSIAVNAAVLAGAGWLLRRLTREWVRRQPPDPPPTG